LSILGVFTSVYLILHSGTHFLIIFSQIPRLGGPFPGPFITPGIAGQLFAGQSESHRERGRLGGDCQKVPGSGRRRGGWFPQGLGCGERIAGGQRRASATGTGGQTSHQGRPGKHYKINTQKRHRNRYRYTPLDG